MTSAETEEQEETLLTENQQSSGGGQNSAGTSAQKFSQMRSKKVMGFGQL